MPALARLAPPSLPSLDALLREEAEAAASTRRAYASDWRLFVTWCGDRGLPSLPASPATVATYIGALGRSGIRPATIARRVAAIRDRHVRAGFPAPTDAPEVRAVVRGVRRTMGAAPRPKAPATADLVRTIVAGIGTDRLLDVRDRALMLLGFASAMRRSELATLAVEDVTEEGRGLRITIRRSKGDQEGEGQTIAVPFGAGATCPVRALRAWLDASGIAAGPVFVAMGKGDRFLPPTVDPDTGRPRGMSGRAIADVVKGRAAAAGLDPDEFAAHSLRSGFLTSAAQRGANVWKLREVSRHKSLDTLAGYVRAVELFDDHAGAGLL
jgi:site-specific recombinase XerD